MTVFLVCPFPRDYNLAPVKYWGELTVINNRFVYGDELRDEMSLPTAFTENLKKAVVEFKPDEDFLLIGGDHVQIVAMSVMLAIEHGRFRTLRWDRNENAYYPVMITGDGP